MKLALTAAVALGAAPLSAGDWVQWRGPARDGVVAAASAPAAWPDGMKRAWRVDVGEGYSSPVFAGGRVFVHSRRDPDEIVTAVDFASGKTLWQRSYPAAFSKNQYAVKMAKGPNSTPLAAGERLFTLGVTGVLSAWAADTGALLWRKDYSDSIDTSKLFCGTATSPLLEDGLLIVQVGSDVRGGRVLALAPKDGAERWVWRGAGPGYASPIAISAGGARQIVTLTNSSIEGIDAKNGAALWSIPFPDEWHENIATPVWTGTHLIVSGTRQGTHAFALAQTSGNWQPREAWKNADVAMYMSSPVLADGILYGHSSKRRGQLVALDAKTGALRWATEGREGAHASVLLTPAHVVFLKNDGQLVLVRRGAPAFAADKSYRVAEGETWAMPVLFPDGLLVRDATGVVRLSFGG
jgi:outer membrane protein assembly factor BamB